MSFISRIQGIFYSNTHQARSDRNKALGAIPALIGLVLVARSMSEYISSLKGRVPLPITDDPLMSSLAKELQEIPDLKPFLLRVEESMKEIQESVEVRGKITEDLLSLELPGGQKINIRVASFDAVINKLVLG